MVFIFKQIITMKIRRIDTLDIFSHAIGHLNRKKTHCRTVSGALEGIKRAPSGSRLSSGLSVEVDGGLKDKRISKNDFKYPAIDKEQSTTQKQKTYILYQKLRTIYSKLSQLYKLNQQKLNDYILKHIKQQYYIYQKQLTHLAKSLHLNKAIPKIILHHPFLSKLHLQMARFCEFIQAYYGQKCLKAVQIVEENILLRENAIRQYTNRERYKTVTKAFYPKLITNQIDIVKEFKSMNIQTGKVLNKAQCEMFHKLRSSEDRISEIFSTVRKQKEIDIFEGRKFTYVIR